MMDVLYTVEHGFFSVCCISLTEYENCESFAVLIQCLGTLTVFVCVLVNGNIGIIGDLMLIPARELDFWVAPR